MSLGFLISFLRAIEMLFAAMIMTLGALLGLCLGLYRKAHVAILLAFLCATTSQGVDTHACQYWLKYLDEIERIELGFLYSVPKIAEQENVYSAMDLTLDLRELLDRYRRKTDKEVRDGE